MKTSLYTHFENTILDNIDFEGYDVTLNGHFDKVHKVYEIFKKEYVHQNNQHLSEQILFAEWLQGLPSVLTVPFYYNEIIENAWVYAKENDDKLLRKKLKNEEQFCTDYWTNLSKTFFTLKENL